MTVVNPLYKLHTVLFSLSLITQMLERSVFNSLILASVIEDVWNPMCFCLYTNQI